MAYTLETMAGSKSNNELKVNHHLNRQHVCVDRRTKMRDHLASEIVVKVYAPSRAGVSGEQPFAG